MVSHQPTTATPQHTLRSLTVTCVATHLRSLTVTCVATLYIQCDSELHVMLHMPQQHGNACHNPGAPTRSPSLAGIHHSDDF